jgi:hypothetical protein
MVQAGVIGAVLLKDQSAAYRTASVSENEPLTRALPAPAAMQAAPAMRVAEPARVLVRFAPDARVSDITALLDDYQASIMDEKGGLFRLQFGRTMSKEEAAGVLAKLQSEKIVSLAVAAQ